MVKKSFLVFSSLSLLFLIVFSSFVSAVPVILSDQGTDVRDISTGNLLSSGHLTVQIWDSASGGTKLYEQYFTNAIINGSWNVMLNNSLSLEYGKIYYKDYQINGDNLLFDGQDRLEFMSPLGLINNASKINFSIISECSAGNAIRKINEDGTVTCESVSGGSSSGGGWTNDSTTTSTTLNVSIGGNLSVSDSGFFGYLGSLVSRITKLFVQDVDVSNNVSIGGNLSVSGQTFITGNLTTSEGIIANYFCNASNCYTIADFLTSSSGSSYNETYALWAYNQSYSGSTFNETYALWSYNETYSGSTYNETYDTWLANYTEYAKYWYNMTSSSSGTYNETYAGLINNDSYLSTYNETYALYAYNMSDGSYNATYALWAYNMTQSSAYEYNQTQPFTDWLSTFLYNYNQTYSGSTFNETYALWAYNMTQSSAYDYNHTSAVETLYGIYFYNMSDGSYNESYESTFNETYALWSYNQTGSASAYDYNHTSAVETLYGIYFYNMSDGSYNESYESTYNETYALWAYNMTQSSAYDYNQTQPFTDWLSTFLYNYNQTYSGSTYNETYALWSYNQTSAVSGSYIPYTGAISNVDLGNNNLSLGNSLSVEGARLIINNGIVNKGGFAFENYFSSGGIQFGTEGGDVSIYTGAMGYASSNDENSDVATAVGLFGLGNNTDSYGLVGIGINGAGGGAFISYNNSGKGLIVANSEEGVAIYSLSGINLFSGYTEFGSDVNVSEGEFYIQNQAVSHWLYNQTYSGSTYNETYALWAYNETYSGSTYNETYDTWLANYTEYNKWWYNMTTSSSGTGSWTNDSTTTSTDLNVNLTSGNLTADDLIIREMVLNGDYKSLNDFFNLFTSAGRLTGGTISDNGDGTVSVASGQGVIRIADDDSSQVKFISWIAKSDVYIPTDSIVYIGVDYNGGSPIVVNYTNSENWDLDTNFPLGTVVNQGGDLYILNDPWWVGDGLTNVIERFQAQGTERDEEIGGLILGYTGTRNPTLTAGKVWARLNEFDIIAKDCSSGDNFYSFYRNGVGGWTKEGPYTQWNNTHYDDNSGVLKPIDNNKFANIWVFIEIDNDNNGQLMLIYPQNQYVSSALAEAEEVPSFPSTWYKHGILTGRILFKKGVDVPIEVQSSFVTQFTPSQATDHGNLAGLTDDDHTQYVKHTGDNANLNLTGYNITASHYFGDGSQLTGISGINATFNQSLTDTLYAGIIWAYNQTYSGSTFNETYALYAYNQTYSGSTFNATYALYAYNMSDGSYNASYALWSYNQTGIGANIINGTTLDITNITNFFYNYNQTTPVVIWMYNQTTAAITNITSDYGKWFYNQTYSGSTYNATYALYAYNQSTGYIPYTGASSNVDLGNNNLTTTGIVNAGFDSRFGNTNRYIEVKEFDATGSALGDLGYISYFKATTDGPLSGVVFEDGLVLTKDDDLPQITFTNSSLSSLGMINYNITFNLFTITSDTLIDAGLNVSVGNDICIDGGNCLSTITGSVTNGTILDITNITNFNYNYNQTTPMVIWMYNQTSAAITNITSDYGKYWYNMTYSGSTYNATYAIYAYNMSDGSYNASYVPYSGATTNVDLGNNNFTTTGIVNAGFESRFGNSNRYVEIKEFDATGSALGDLGYVPYFKATTDGPLRGVVFQDGLVLTSDDDTPQISFSNSSLSNLGLITFDIPTNTFSVSSILEDMTFSVTGDISVSEGNVDVSGNNITTVDCITFASGGKICSGA